MFCVFWLLFDYKAVFKTEREDLQKMKKCNSNLLRKAIVLLLSVLMALNCCFSVLAISYAGDFDNDGALRANDIVNIRNAFLEVEDFTDSEFVKKYDVNGDGVVDARDIVVLKKEVAYFVEEEKFEAKEITEIGNADAVLLSELFNSVEGVKIDSSRVKVEVDTDVTYKVNTDTENWENSSILFDGTGSVTVTISEYCIPTSITLNLVKEVKFDINDSLPSVFGNAKDTTVGALFNLKSGYTPSSNMKVTAETVSGDVEAAIGEINVADWQNTVIDFNGTGSITITIEDNSQPESVTVTVDDEVKFAENDGASNEYGNASIITVGTLFEVIEGYTVDSSKVNVTAKINSGDVTCEIVLDKENWQEGKLEFDGTGSITLTIVEESKPTDITITVIDADKFSLKVDDPYTVENTQNVVLGDIFAEIAGVDVDSDKVAVNISKVNEEDTVAWSFAEDKADWTNGVIDFSGAGQVTVTIEEDSNSTTLTIIVKQVEKFVAVKETVTVDRFTTVSVGELFALVDGMTVNTANVVLTTDNASWTADKDDWAKGTVTFNNVGEVTVTIYEDSLVATVKVNVLQIDKFVAAEGVSVTETDTKTLGELFNKIDGVTVDSSKVKVTVTGGTYTADVNDWENGTITFTTPGNATVTIEQDSNVATATVTVTKRESVAKFAVKFTNTEKYLYRVGNANTVALGSLFRGIDGAEIKAVSATIETLNGTSASGTFTANSDWTKATIQFSGNGVVKVTITDKYYCIPTELEVEVVDAVNATSATSAKTNNVVLLNDVNMSTLEVSGGYTLYGNGFKMEAKNDIMGFAMGYSFVVLNNGVLDNVQIICPNFSYSIVYTSNIHSADNTAKPDDPNSDARGNVRSAVMVDGNSKIINSYVHGGRAAIYLRSGNLLVDNSTISGGATANIHAVSAKSLTLRDATLIQRPFKANVNDTSKTVMGLSGLFECDESGISTPLILEGKLKQHAWVTEEDKQYAPADAEPIVANALTKTDYIHKINGKDSLNLGFTYIPQNAGGNSSCSNLQDKRTNSTAVPYDAVKVGITLASAYVYSYKNTNGTDPDFIIGEDYVYAPVTQGTTAPTVKFTDTNADRVFDTQFDVSDLRWESNLTVNLDNGDYTFDFAKLLVQKYGKNLSYTVKTDAGVSIDTSNAMVLNKAGVTVYILDVQDGDITHTCYFVLTATKKAIPEPSAEDTTGGTPLLVVKSKNSDWSCAIPALEGIKIKYWTSANNSVVLDLATLTPTSTGQQNGTNNFWEYSDGYKLKVSCGYIHEGKQIYGMPVVVNNSGNKMYFTISSTNGYVSTGTSGRTVTITYEFTDPNGKTITFDKTWQFNYADYKNGTQYSYSDFVNGTLKEAGSGGCVTPDTLVTLADGSQVRVDTLTGDEELLVWNHETGSFDKALVAYIVNHDEQVSEKEIIHLYFSNDSQIRIIGEHVFFDATLGKYVAIDTANVEQYIGHKFIGLDESLLEIELVKAETYKETTSAYEVVSYKHLTCFTNNILSTSAYLDKLLNIFDIDLSTMAYTAENVQKDIETYGLYTYADFEDLISEEAFELYNAKYLKVAVGKGYITWDDILDLIDIYFDVDVQPIN